MTCRYLLQHVQSPAEAAIPPFCIRPRAAISPAAAHLKELRTNSSRRPRRSADWCRTFLRWHAKCCCWALPMNAATPYDPSISLGDAENWLALGTGALLLLVGASRRSPAAPASRCHPHRCCIGVSPAVGRTPERLRPPRQHEDRPRRRARRARSGIDPVGGPRRRRLPLLASPRKSPAVHDAPQPGDGDSRRHSRTGWPQVLPGWPSSGRRRSSTRSRTSFSRGARFLDLTS